MQHIKELVSWCAHFEKAISRVLEAMESDLDQEASYNIVLDRIMDVEGLYHKFVVEAVGVRAQVTRTTINRLEGLKNFEWTIDKMEGWYNKYCGVLQQVLEKEEED